MTFMTRDQTIDLLNGLIQVAEDSHEGYTRAAEETENDVFRALFNDLSAQRAAMVRDLQYQVAALGGPPESSGTVLGSAHRLFTGLKSAVSGHDPTAVLEEVERGETEAVRRFEKALDHDLPPGLSDVIGDYLGRLKIDRDRIIALRAGA